MEDEGPAMAVVEPVRPVLRPSGGVGGLPMEGFKEISLVASSRGLRNMALRGGSRHEPSVDRVVGLPPPRRGDFATSFLRVVP